MENDEKPGSNRANGYGRSLEKRFNNMFLLASEHLAEGSSAQLVTRVVIQWLSADIKRRRPGFDSKISIIDP